MENLSVSLGDRIKSYEKRFQSYISEQEYVVIRLDGDSFSKFTKGFRKPFDKILVETMNRTTKALFERFSCCFAYTQSDEITLVINKTNNMVLGGKVQKLVSLTAGFCSTKFNMYLKEVLEEEKDCVSQEFYDLIYKKIGNAWFDSRVFGIKDDFEVFNTVLWRMRDAERNSISMLGYANFSHRELLNINSKEKLEKYSENNIFWDDLDNGLKYGYYFKRVVYKRSDGVERRKVESFAKKFNYSDENVKLIFEREIQL